MDLVAGTTEIATGKKSQKKDSDHEALSRAVAIARENQQLRGRRQQRPEEGGGSLNERMHTL